MFQYCPNALLVSSLSKTTHLLGIVATLPCIKISLRIFKKEMESRAVYVCESKCREHILNMQAALTKDLCECKGKLGRGIPVYR